MQNNLHVRALLLRRFLCLSLAPQLTDFPAKKWWTLHKCPLKLLRSSLYFDVTNLTHNCLRIRVLEGPPNMQYYL